MTWAPDYATTTDLAAYVRIGDDVDDAQLALAVTAASRSVDRAAGRQFGLLAAAAEWFFTLEWDRRLGTWLAPVDDVATTTGMVVSVDGTATTDYKLMPRQAVTKGRVWTTLVLGTDVAGTATEDALSVTASWGWPAVPATIKQATLIQASRFLARRDSPYGVTGSPADGSETRLLARVDPDVRVLLDAYVRRVWAL